MSPAERTAPIRLMPLSCQPYRLELAVPNGRELPQQPPEVDRFNSESEKAIGCVPLLFHNRPIGVLALNRMDRSSFAREDIDFLDQIADHVTGNLEDMAAHLEVPNRKEVSASEEVGTEGEIDEVGEIPLELQPKLLRVLQEWEFERLGSSQTLRSDARLIAATNRDLAKMVGEHEFRADLFYRLNVFPIRIPPLRERSEDIPVLVRHFMCRFARRMNRKIDSIPSETMRTLLRYDWLGPVCYPCRHLDFAVAPADTSVPRTSTKGKLQLNATYLSEMCGS